MRIDVDGTFKRHENSIISIKSDIRVDEGGLLEIGEGSKIDDDVRVVIAKNAVMSIGRNVKIGKGTIVNCGGRILIEDNAAIYGYCMLQTSIWKVVDGERIYSHGSVNIGESAVVSPYSLLAKGSVVNQGEVVPPRANLGEWLTS